MKLRYYMRGLGIGVFVTAILMGVTLHGKTEQLSDAEIIERAKALGMEEKYETTVLADSVSDNDTEDKIAQTEEEKTSPEVQEIETDANEEDETPVQDEISKPEESPTTSGKTIRITVNGGDGSGTVARKLADAGIIEDATAYDKFLCSNGYDKRIRVGTYDIPENATDEEIAKMITTRSN